jgi:hypothetical protein
MNATAAKIVADLEAQGYTFSPLEDGGVWITPRLTPGVRVDVRSHRDDIAVFLRRREAVVQAQRIAQNAAMREGRFPLPEAKVCTFHIGAAGKPCRRCEGSWMEHFPPSSSTRTERDVK